MKTIRVVFVSFTVSFTLSIGLSLALTGIHLAGAETPPTQVSSCNVVKNACQTAGFTAGGHTETEKKGLILDCVRPLLKEGRSIAGVTVPEKDIQDCKKERKAKRAKQRKLRKQRAQRKKG